MRLSSRLLAFLLALSFPLSPLSCPALGLKLAMTANAKGLVGGRTRKATALYRGWDDYDCAASPGKCQGEVWGLG